MKLNVIVFGLFLKVVWMFGLHVSWIISYVQPKIIYLSLCCKLKYPRVVFFPSFTCVARFIFLIKPNVDERWLCLGFHNVFTFAQYFEMFPPFTICMPSIVFFSGGYNLRVKKFPSAFTIFSHLFFRCSLILLFEFFLHL